MGSNVAHLTSLRAHSTPASTFFKVTVRPHCQIGRKSSFSSEASFLLLELIQNPGANPVQGRPVQLQMWLGRGLGAVICPPAVASGAAPGTRHMVVIRHIGRLAVTRIPESLPPFCGPPKAELMTFDDNSRQDLPG